MSTQRHAREAARRRDAKRAQRLAQVRAQRARQRRISLITLGVVLGVIAVAALVWWLVGRANTSWATSPTPPPATLAEGRAWTAVISTSEGDITVQLDGAAAPQAVASFVALARDGFFDGTSCHRLVTAGIFVLQCGDPTGTGTGGPAYRFGPVENAPATNVYPAGTLAMARAGNNPLSMGSQFFLVYNDSTIPSDSAGGYTVFGTVTSGLDIVEAVAQAGTVSGATDGPPALSVTITEVTAS